MQVIQELTTAVSLAAADGDGQDMHGVERDDLQANPPVELAVDVRQVRSQGFRV